MYDATVCYIILAPIAGLAEAPKLSLGDIELDLITEHEAQTLLDNGLLQAQSARHLAFASTAYCLRQRMTTTKLIGDAESATPLPDTNTALPAFQEILNALRLLQSEPIVLSAIVCLDGELTLCFGTYRLRELSLVAEPGSHVDEAIRAATARLTVRVRLSGPSVVL